MLSRVEVNIAPYNKQGEDMENIEKDLQKIVDYMWEIEFNHWEEENNPEEHIFHSFNNIKNYLRGRRGFEND